MNVKRIICVLLVACILVAIPIIAYAYNESSLDGGRASWYGGINSNDKIYSKVWDHKVDGRRYHVTVWVQDDNGNKTTKTGTTNGVDSAGQVIATRKATYNHLFATNKSGYKNLSMIT